MIRNIIRIDENKCNGCGLCVSSCHESAIKLIDGKAKLIRDDYCDGLGNCLPACPTNAITFEQREALPYDEKAVEENKAAQNALNIPPACGCPDSLSKSIKETKQYVYSDDLNENTPKLPQWPVQIKLIPVHALYFNHADLLIAADCCAYTHRDFHNQFIKNKITLIGCPKLDSPDYSEKLTDILANNDIKTITVARMEVPCCRGLVNAVINAMHNSGKIIPWQIITISTDGEIIIKEIKNGKYVLFSM